MTIDLDKWELQVRGFAWDSPTRDEMLEFIALARKGTTPSMALRECQQFNVELIARAGAYQRALRFYADVRHYARDGLHAEPYIAVDGGKKAREALEVADK